VFDQVGWGEMGVLLLLALFVFGPDRLPGLARDLGRALRKGRQMVQGLTADLKAELGPEVGDLDLASLHPKRIVADMMRDDDDEPLSLTKPVASPVVPASAARAELPVGESAPWDPDTT
jgi:sec-independent protein translocase protein TatB